MVLTNFIKIKNYEDGINGNMKVSLDADMKILENAIVDYKCNPRSVSALICTAVVTDEKVIDAIASIVDTTTPADRVIVVSKKFLKLTHKKQLALLEIQNSAIGLDEKYVTSNTSRRAYGEIMAIERYGKLAVCCAIKKERRIYDKSVKKASKGLHFGYKKAEAIEKRAMKKLQKTVVQTTDQLIEDDEIFEDKETVTPANA